MRRPAFACCQLDLVSGRPVVTDFAGFSVLLVDTSEPVGCADAVLDGRGLSHEPQAAAAPHGGCWGGQQTPGQGIKVHGQVSGRAACQARER